MFCDVSITLAGILVVTDEQVGPGTCSHQVRMQLLFTAVIYLLTSTASKMGACLGQETAHKASLDSFLGNHDEVIKFVITISK